MGDLKADTKINIHPKTSGKDDTNANSKSPRKRRAKSKTWKTKFGSRRVRHDPPTLEEAIVAASGLTDDLSEQIEIAASLMGVPQDEVRAAMKAAALTQKYASTIVLARGARGPRPIVVERKPSRRIMSERPVGR